MSDSGVEVLMLIITVEKYFSILFEGCSLRDALPAQLRVVFSISWVLPFLIASDLKIESETCPTSPLFAKIDHFAFRQVVQLKGNGYLRSVTRAGTPRYNQPQKFRLCFFFWRAACYIQCWHSCTNSCYLLPSFVIKMSNSAGETLRDAYC